MVLKVTLYSLAAAVALSMALVSTANLLVPDDPSYQPAAALPDYQQASFEEYINETRTWLTTHRVFLTDDAATEVDANTPFELAPEGDSAPQKGILLVHGLGDSPFYLRDVSTVLVEQGFLVRTVLLPGHGSKPADLTLPVYEDWRQTVEHHVGLLQEQVRDVWLGGFSTGANLVTAYAGKNDDIKGLLLLSPAFVPKDALYVLAPFANHFIDWLDFDPDEDNYTRYSTLAMNGAALLSESIDEIKDVFSDKSYDKPVLVTVSESDSVIDAAGVLAFVQNSFTHPDSRLIWYGEKQIDDNRVKSFSSSLPQHRISTFSHMSVLFSPSNTYYGKTGSQLICDNGQSEDAEAQCTTLENRWYSSFDHVEDGKFHARLTWNPYFEELTEMIKALVQ